MKIVYIHGQNHKGSTYHVAKLLGEYIREKTIINEFKPDVILGTGGYVCWPVLIAGAELKIPTAIHESNILPGLTTRIISKKIDVVFLNNEETKKYLTKKIMYPKTRLIRGAGMSNEDLDINNSIFRNGG